MDDKLSFVIDFNYCCTALRVTASFVTQLSGHSLEIFCYRNLITQGLAVLKEIPT